VIRVATLVPIIGALLAAGCRPPDGPASRPAAPTTSPAVAVKVQTARPQALPLRVPIIGTLAAAEEVTISTKVAGVLRRTFVDVGDFAPPGAALTQVDAVDYELAVARARAALGEVLARLGVTEVPDASFELARVSSVVRAAAQLENARFTHDRLTNLGTAVSEQEMSDVAARLRVAAAEYQSALDEAAAQVALARERDALLRAADKTLTDARTCAPAIPSTLGAAGAERWVVAERLVTEGRYLAVADPLYRLVIDNPLKLRSRVPERYATDVQIGQRVELEPLDGARALTGAVTRISPAVDPATRTFEIEALVDNPAGAFRPGSFARGALIGASRHPSICVPDTAIDRTGGMTRLFTVAGNVAQRRTVQLGRQVGGQAEVLSGLTEGDAVVIEGLATLLDGTAVTIQAESRGR
jgi:RND family efflux transporter MFP subunit